MRQLEDIPSVQLLERTSRGCALTPAGVVFLEGARDTVFMFDRTITAARNTAELPVWSK